MLPLSNLYPSSQHRPRPGKAPFKARPAPKREADAAHHIKTAIFHPGKSHHAVRDCPFSVCRLSSSSLSSFAHLCLWSNLKFTLQKQSTAAGGCLFHIPSGKNLSANVQFTPPLCCLRGIVGCLLPYLWTLLCCIWVHVGASWEHSLISEFNQYHLWWRHHFHGCSDTTPLSLTRE